MSTEVLDPAVRFSAFLASRYGLLFPESRYAFLWDVLRRRSAALGMGAPAYVERLESRGASREESRAILSEVTVTETYFFRGADQLRAFSDLVVAADARPLRVLSVGAASGEEAYTIAMLLRNTAPEMVVRSSVIVGIDGNVAMLAKAARARYSAWSLRETEPIFRERWFRREGTEYSLDPSITGMVTFEEVNLGADGAAFAAEPFDVVFCRNVIMYFTEDGARRIVQRICQSLRPGGHLFLGHAETLRGISEDFELVQHGDAFFYRSKSAARSFSAFGAAASGGSPALSEHWVDAIRNSSDRVRSLTAEATEPAVKAPPDDRVGLPAVLNLFSEERFADAQTYLDSLPPDRASDPEVVLCRAVLLLHTGDLAAAETASAALTDVPSVAAGARYILSLCREGRGDRVGAAHHARLAITLDATFAMPRLRLGLIARRAGHARAARRELERALELLAHERQDRVSLFGGGFTRKALLDLCRAELASCAGAA